MTTITGCEIYGCPTCGEHVRATVYGSMNSWSYPGSEVARTGRLVNGVFGDGVRDLHCANGHEFTSSQAELIEIEDYSQTRSTKRNGLLARLWQLLRP